MNKFCSNCGTEMDASAIACPNCGAPANGGISSIQPQITKRDIVVSIILSVVTCGIYALYWFVCLTDDSNALSKDEKTTSGGIAVILSIVTCWIYGVYWNYKLGKKLFEAGQLYNKNIGDNSILYLILSIFGFGIVSYCIAQSDINKFAN